MAQQGKFLVIAHRGASSYAPENTFAAFDKALEIGVDHAELDVHFTSDGHIVVVHDDTLDRTSDGSGPVTAHTLAQLRALDAGSWFGPEYAGERIRSFGEVLEHYKGRIHFHVEIKGRSDGLTKRTIDMIRGYGMTDSVTMTSFRKERIAESAAYAPELPSGWLVPMGPGSQWDDSLIDQALEIGMTQLCPRAELITPEIVDKIRARGLVVRCHSALDESLMRRVVDAGADGTTINFPDKLLDYLSEAKT